MARKVQRGQSPQLKGLYKSPVSTSLGRNPFHLDKLKINDDIDYKKKNKKAQIGIANQFAGLNNVARQYNKSQQKSNFFTSALLDVLGAATIPFSLAEGAIGGTFKSIRDQKDEFGKTI